MDECAPPPYADALDYTWDGTMAMNGNCRCTRKKWSRTCECLRCLEHFGEAERFSFLPKYMPVSATAHILQPSTCAGYNSKDLGEKVIGDVTYLTSEDGKIIGPVNPLKHWRVGGIATYARLPLLKDVQPSDGSKIDIAVVGVPFDSGCSFRPGARFGPEAVRTGSKLIRPYIIAQNMRPLLEKQVADAGDLAHSPFNIDQAMREVYEGCRDTLKKAKRLCVIGGDHTLSYPVIKAVKEQYGRVCMIHFDAHMDTFPPQFGQDVWHGSPFRKCWDEGLLSEDNSTHVGIRATTWGPGDFEESDGMGIKTLTAENVHDRGVDACVKYVRDRATKDGKVPVYLTIDIDVLDPSVAPGTGTPEIGGLQSHQLLKFIRGLKGLPIVSCDVVEVSPAYDHASITSMAAANVALESIALMGASMEDDGF
eukprot:gnl/MRDRNA2_/MRDRNA2_73715_c0_seq1.p1 gnl/MRDRNA2_/MRDRNA2_73715_c0~~gnl/MRDRNA2_/MRDRNA2_73715_c0_seq1.p1  ORF type:complete len:423 (-),score=58.80 gnl/MRDRNA2_/MRDRNA2_73715_c0_seq1:109-1377(-)